MTLIETTQLLLLTEPDDDTSEHVCLNRSHAAVDRVCTECRCLHLPTMETVAYCPCEAPEVYVLAHRAPEGSPGILSWQCQRCGLPNMDVLRGRLPVGKASGTVSGTEPCH